MARGVYGIISRNALCARRDIDGIVPVSIPSPKFIAMNINYAKIIAYVKNMKTADFAYPGIFILFFIATITTFSIATRFITANINKIFSSEGVAGEGALNAERYTRVVKKLNIPLATPETDVQTAVSEEGTQEQTSTATTTSTVNTTTTSTPPLDKSTITIFIKNSTAKKGIASVLAKTLEDAGFSAPKTGNETGHYATTTILIKESKRDYAPLLLEAISTSYPDAITATTTDSAPYDATIVIGEK